MDHRRIYLAAAVWFADLVEQVPGDRWDGPGLGVWNLRELTGHTVSAAFRTVLTSLGQPALRCDMPFAAGYYALARTVDPAFYRAALAARVGVEVGDGVTVLLALTGRRALAEGFCVL